MIFPAILFLAQSGVAVPLRMRKTSLIELRMRSGFRLLGLLNLSLSTLIWHNHLIWLINLFTFKFDSHWALIRCQVKIFLDSLTFLVFFLQKCQIVDLADLFKAWRHHLWLPVTKPLRRPFPTSTRTFFNTSKVNFTQPSSEFSTELCFQYSEIII